jgi:hypothetical protein
MRPSYNMDQILKGRPIDDLNDYLAQINSGDGAIVDNIYRGLRNAISNAAERARKRMSF